MNMEQKQEQLLSEWGQLAKLDAAAQAVSAILTANERKYGFFGGYAVSLLGGSRMTNVSQHRSPMSSRIESRKPPHTAGFN